MRSASNKRRNTGENRRNASKNTRNAGKIRSHGKINPDYGRRGTGICRKMWSRNSALRGLLYALPGEPMVFRGAVVCLRNPADSERKTVGQLREQPVRFEA